MKFLIALIIGFLIFVPASKAAEIELIDRYNLTPVSITVDQDHGVFAFATWCPYCRKLSVFLNDPKVQPYLKDKSFTFVIYPEWQTIEAKLRKKGEVYKLEDLKAESGDPDLYKPEIVKNLPGPSYFCSQQLLDSIRAFPSAYSIKESGFTLDAKRWFELNTKVPKALLKAYFED